MHFCTNHPQSSFNIFNRLWLCTRNFNCSLVKLIPVFTTVIFLPQIRVRFQLICTNDLVPKTWVINVPDLENHNKIA